MIEGYERDRGQLVAPESSRWYMVSLLFLATILSYVDRGIINILVPDLRRSLGLSEVEVSLLQGISFSLCFALAGLAIGVLVDRFNRRTIIIGGILCWSAATTMCGLSQTFWQLFAARAAVGIGEACLLPAAFSMIGDRFSADRRGLPISIMSAATCVGGTGAPLIGGLILYFLGNGGPVMVPVLGATESWRASFLIAGAPGVLFALLMLTMTEPARIAQQRRETYGESYTRFLLARWRVFLLLYPGFSLVAMVGYISAYWAPTVLIRNYGYAPAAAGVAIGIVLFPAGVLGPLLGGLIGDRLARTRSGYGRLRAWFGGTLPIVGGAICFSINGPAWLFLTALFLIQATASGIGGIGYAALYDVMPRQFQGRAMAVNMLTSNILGLGFGVTAVAFLTQYVFQNDLMVHHSIAWLVGAAALISPLLIVLQLHGYQRLRTSLADPS